MKNFFFYTILLAAALLSLLAWRKWAVDIQKSAVDIVGGANGLRIISTSPNITEILFELGLGGSVVGVTDYCNYPEKAKSKQSIGSIKEPDIETIIKLKPTNVFVTSSDFHRSLGLKLESMGLRVNVFDVDTTIKGIEETILEIGLITGNADDSLKLNKHIYENLEQVREKSRQMPSRPKVLVVIQSEPIIAVGKNTYIDEVLTIAGGDNVITDAKWTYPMINAESLLLLAPDIIIEVCPFVSPKRDETALSHYKWNIPATKNKNVFVVDADVVSRPGPRVVLAAQQMQQIIFMAQEQQ